MFKKAFIFSTVLTAVIVMAVSTQIFSYPGGAPVGKTGSPGDASNCTSCHDATMRKVDNHITSDAVNNVYTPGQTYTITAKMSGVETVKRIGFEVSPQNVAGKLLGTLTLTDAEKTQLLDKGKYITHTNKGSLVTGGMGSWTFKWTAPAAGAGDVVFYGSFLVGSKPQVVYTTSYTLKEKK
ncbi:MAG: Reeler domain-containing protein [Bacteroidota bacterium]